MKNGKEFARLVDEFGASEENDSNDTSEGADAKVDSHIDKTAGVDEKKEIFNLMSEEERNRGAVPFSAYSQYLRYAGGIFWAPVIILLLALMQGASGMY